MPPLTTRIGSQLFLLPVRDQIGPIPALNHAGFLLQRAAAGDSPDPIRQELKELLPAFGLNPVFQRLIRDVMPDVFRFVQGEEISSGLFSAAGRRFQETAKVLWETASKDISPAELVQQISGIAASRDSTNIFGKKTPITSVFADISGFTLLTEEINKADRVIEIVNELQEGLAEELTSAGGTEVEFWGDGVRSFFGAPKVRIDDAVRAVQAARKMQKFMERWNKKYWDLYHDPQDSSKLPKPLRDWIRKRIDEGKTTVLDIRIGISTGEAAWGLTGEKGKKRHNAYGRQVNIAARMEAVAPPGGIVVTPWTLERLHSRFEVKEMEPVRPKNVNQAITPYLIVREKESAKVFLPFEVDQMPFRGRESEMKNLRQAFEETVAEKKGQIILFSAPPGLGKSRLAAEIANELEGRGVLPFNAKGDEGQNQLPYSTIASAMRRWLKLETEADFETVQEAVKSCLDPFVIGNLKPEEVEMHVQFLGYLLTGSWPERGISGQKDYFSQNPKELWEGILKSVIFFFKNLTNRQPVAWILDDLQWIDSGSLEFLKRLSEELKDQPFFVPCFCRPEFLGARQPLLEEAHIRHLEGLPSHEFDFLLDEMLDPGSNNDTRAFIKAQSNQNPFLFKQLVSAIKGGWRIEWNPITKQWDLMDPNGNTVPTEMHSFLQARLDLLPKTQQYLLRLASVIGAEFTLEEVEGLLKEIDAPEKLFPKEVWSILKKDVEGILDELVTENVLGFENGRYQFPHALLKETVYKQIFEADCEVFHRGRARYLKLNESPELLAAIASHYDRGREEEAASEYYYKAADEAKGRRMLDTAIKFYRRGYELAKKPVDKFRILRGWDDALVVGLRFAEEDEIHQLSLALLDQLPQIDTAGLHFRKGRSLNWRRDAGVDRKEAYRELFEALRLVDEAIDDLKREESIQRRAEESSDAVREALKLKGSILTELGVYYSKINDFNKARVEYQRVIEMAQILDDHLILGRAYWGISYVDLELNNYSEALQAAFEARKHFLSCKPQEIWRAIGALANAGSILTDLGSYEEAEMILREAKGLSRIFGGTGRGTEILNDNLGRVFHLQGKKEEAISILQENLAVNPSHPFEVYNRVYLALVYIDISQSVKADQDEQKAGYFLDLAMEEAKKALEIAENREEEREKAMVSLVISRILLEQGKKEQALAANKIAVKKLENGEFESEAYYIRAQIFKEMGRFHMASSYVEKVKQNIEFWASNIKERKYRNSFLNSVELNKEIMKLWLELKAQIVQFRTQDDLNYRASTLWKHFQSEPVRDVEDEIVSLPLHHPGKIETDDETEEPGKYGIASVFFDHLPVEDVFETVVSGNIHIDENPGKYKVIPAKDVRLVLFLGADERFYIYLNWRIGMDQLPYDTQIAVLDNLKHSPYYEELLIGDLYSSTDGSKRIDLKRYEGDEVLTSTGFRVKLDPKLRANPDEFGWLKWRFASLSNEKTGLDFSWEREMFTYHLLKIFAEYVKIIMKKGPDHSINKQ